MFSLSLCVCVCIYIYKWLVKIKFICKSIVSEDSGKVAEQKAPGMCFWRKLPRV